MKRTLACIAVALAVGASAAACKVAGPLATAPTLQASTPTRQVASPAARCATTVDSRSQPGMLTYHLWPASSPTMVSGYQTITLDASACGKSAVGPDPVCSGTFPWFALPGTDPNSALSNLGVKKVVSAMVQGAHPVPRGTLVTVQEVREKVFVLGDGASAMDNPITGFAAACAKPMMWPEPATHPRVVAYRSSARSQDASGMVPAIFAASGNKIFWLEFDSSDNNKTGWTEADYLRITHEAIALADQL